MEKKSTQDESATEFPDIISDTLETAGDAIDDTAEGIVLREVVDIIEEKEPDLGIALHSIALLVFVVFTLGCGIGLIYALYHGQIGSVLIMCFFFFGSALAVRNVNQKIKYLNKQFEKRYQEERKKYGDI